MDASKISLFVSWKPDRIDSEVENRKRMDDPESLRQLGQKLEAVQRVWKSYIVDASRGEILPRVGDGVDRGQLPADCLAGLEKVRQQAGQWLQSDVSMGVGMSMQEGDRALQISRFRGGDAITLWDEETMQPELEEAHRKAGEEAVKDLSKADEPKGPKETPKNKGNAGGGFSGRSEPGAEEKPMPPIPEGSEHSMGEVAAHEMSGRPEIEGTHSGDLEEEFHDHAGAQEQGDQEAAEAKNRYADTRQKVVQILQQVKQAAPQLEQLKQQAPGLYQVLMEMTQALILTGKSLLEAERADQGEQPQQDENVQKNERLNKAWEDPKTAASVAVFQDAAMEGHGQVLGDPNRENPIHHPIAMPPGRSKGMPTARTRSPQEGSWKDGVFDPTPVPREGWELNPAASRRTEKAYRWNERGRQEEYRGAGDSPSASSAVVGHEGGRAVATDRGGIQGGWENPHRVDEAKSGEARYWGDVSSDALAGAFPIPSHPLSAETGHSGPDAYGRSVEYSWGYSPAKYWEEGSKPTVYIRSNLKAPGRSGWASNGPGMPQGLSHFEVDPNTGLISETGERHYQQAQLGGEQLNEYQRQHLNGFLASLKGMHKGEPDPLEKGKLPLPENAPKHTHVTWPIGWTGKTPGEIKVAHPDEGGKTTWVSVRAGQVLSNDGHAISSKNPMGR